MKKARLVLFGILCAIISAEAVMRVGAFLWTAGAARDESPDDRSGALRILCLGESTTARDPGTPKGDISWPRQLEDILNAGAGGRKYVVINKGVPATDTAVIAASLPTYLRQFQPNLVVSMMGINDNQWYGVVEFKQGWLGRIGRFLWKLKVVKLLRYFKHELFVSVFKRKALLAATRRARDRENKTTNAYRACLYADDHYIEPDAFQHWENACRQAIREHQNPLKIYQLMGIEYSKAKKYDLAIRMFERYIELAGNIPWPYSTLIGLYRDAHRFGDIEHVFRKARALVSRENMPIVLTAMAQAYAGQGQWKRAQGFYREAIAIGTDDDAALDITIGRIEPRFGKDAMTAANYRTTQRILSERGIPWVVMQYPLLDVHRLKRIFEDASGIVFVSNQQTFERAMAHGRYADYFTDRFSPPFGHCTAKGNHLIAKHLAGELYAHGLLPKKS